MKEREWSRNALFLDRDQDWVFAIDPASAKAARRSMEEFFSIWGMPGSRITDVTCCVFEQNSAIPNHAITWMGSKYILKNDHGHPCDYDHIFGRYSIEGLYRTYTEYNVDPMQIFIETMRRAGIRPWFALRMNDAHYLYEDNVTYIKADIFYEELSAGHMIGDQYGYFGRCYDFSYPRIREKILAFIHETLAKYDVYGLSLDFLREPYCFDYRNNPDCHIIMTEFIREVKKVINTVETERNTRIKLMVRLPHTPAESLAFGFDAATWCKEGLVDAVEPCARWECVNSGIPVKKWRKCIGDKVALIPGVEARSLSGYPVKDCKADFSSKIASAIQPEQVRAYYAAWKECGADGLFLANLCYNTPRNRKMWMLDPVNPEKDERHFIVTYQDISSGIVPNPYKPLPLKLPEMCELKLEAGQIKKENAVKVFIDFEGEEPPVLSVDSMESLNAAPCEPVIKPSDSDAGVLLTPHKPFVYILPSFESGGQLLLHFSGQGIVHYVEIQIS